jgi:hypothetical protein
MANQVFLTWECSGYWTKENLEKLIGGSSQLWSTYEFVQRV